MWLPWPRPRRPPEQLTVAVATAAELLQRDAEEAVLDRFWVRGALTRLPAQEREVLELAYFADLSHAQIAARLDQLLGTVTSRIRRVLANLADVAGERWGTSRSIPGWPSWWGSTMPGRTTPSCASTSTAAPRAAAASPPSPPNDAALRAAGPPPPDGLDTRVLAVPEEHLQRPAPRRRRSGLAAAGVALAAGVGLTLALRGTGGADRPFTPDRRAAPSRAGSPVRAVAELETSSPTERIRRVVRGLEDAGARTYRLWLRGEAGEVALGPFRPGACGRCVVVLEAPQGK
jgi:hypothetical protein